jgi:hypothetical protein
MQETNMLPVCPKQEYGNLWTKEPWLWFSELKVSSTIFSVISLTNLSKTGSFFFFGQSHAIDLGHVKEPYRAWVRCFFGQIYRPLFLTRDSPASLPDGSGCRIRMVRMRVLGLQTSHLILIRTNLVYGTALAAACARQACSVSGFFFVWFGMESINVPDVFCS